MVARAALGADGNDVAHRGAIERRERRVKRQLEGGLHGNFDEHAGAPQHADDAPDEGVEHCLEFVRIRRPGTVNVGRTVLEGVGTVEREKVQANVSN